MASRRIREVEKRYVPQQESYRNLPSPTPTAETRRVTSDRLSPSPAAVRLQNLAKGFSALHGGLADYLSAEKSFEEANRAEAEVYGRLGYTYEEAQAAAQGHLDYGVRRGYEMGRATTDVSEVSIKYRAALEQAKKEITPENFSNSETAIEDVKRFADGIFEETLKEQGIDLRNSSPAYLEASGKALVQLKLEGHIEAAETYRQQLEKASADNYSREVKLTVENVLMPLASVIHTEVGMETPEVHQTIRDEISRLSKMAADVYHIDRRAANVLVVESMTDSIRQLSTEALYSQANKEAYANIGTLETIAMGLVHSVNLPDTSGGQRMTTMASNPELLSAIGNLRNITTNLSNSMDNLRRAQQQREINLLTSRLALDIFIGAKDMTEVTDELKALGASEPENSESIIESLTSLHRMYESGALDTNRLTKDEYQKYLFMAYSGQYNSLDILRASASNGLPKELTSEMLRGVQAVEHERALAEQERAKALTTNFNRLHNDTVSGNFSQTQILYESVVQQWSERQTAMLLKARAAFEASHEWNVKMDKRSEHPSFRWHIDQILQGKITRDEIGKLVNNDKGLSKHHAALMRARTEYENTVRWAEREIVAPRHPRYEELVQQILEGSLTGPDILQLSFTDGMITPEFEKELLVVRKIYEQNERWLKAEEAAMEHPKYADYIMSALEGNLDERDIHLLAATDSSIKPSFKRDLLAANKLYRKRTAESEKLLQEVKQAHVDSLVLKYVNDILNGTMDRKDVLQLTAGNPEWSKGGLRHLEKALEVREAEDAEIERMRVKARHESYTDLVLKSLTGELDEEGIYRLAAVDPTITQEFKRDLLLAHGVFKKQQERLVLPPNYKDYLQEALDGSLSILDVQRLGVELEFDPRFTKQLEHIVNVRDRFIRSQEEPESDEVFLRKANAHREQVLRANRFALLNIVSQLNLPPEAEEFVTTMVKPLVETGNEVVDESILRERVQYHIGLWGTIEKEYAPQIRTAEAALQETPKELFKYLHWENTIKKDIIKANKQIELFKGVPTRRAIYENELATLEAQLEYLMLQRSKESKKGQHSEKVWRGTTFK